MYIKKGVLIINAKWGVPSGFKAKCWGPVCFVPDEHIKYLDHEVRHSRDWRADPIRSVYRYFKNWRFRLWLELRAYKLSDTPEDTARLLRRGYCLPTTYTAQEIAILTNWAWEMPFDEFTGYVK